jgi:hypothetical protein
MPKDSRHRAGRVGLADALAKGLCHARLGLSA